MDDERTLRHRRHDTSSQPGPSSGDALSADEGPPGGSELLRQVRAFDDIGAWVNAETAVGEDAATELRRRVNQSGQ